LSAIETNFNVFFLGGSQLFMSQNIYVQQFIGLSTVIQRKSQFCTPTTSHVRNLMLNAANNDCRGFAFKCDWYITSC